MADISAIIAPKSDQLNADDLAAGERTIHIRGVEVSGAGREQPISVFYEGDGGKPWKPCKTMARLLANLWQSPDTSKWVGRSVTLYRDPDVTWAGAKIGGIRVRAVSHIDAPRQVAITESKTKRKLATISIIKAEVREIPKPDGAAKWADGYIAKIEAAQTIGELVAFENEKAPKLEELREKRPELHQRCVEVAQARASALAQEGPADEQRGEETPGQEDGWE